MILADVQKLSPGNLIRLFELDCTPIGGGFERYHNHNDGPITWQGNVYHPWSINAENFERTGEGQQPNPSIAVGNIGVGQNGEPYTGVITALCLAMDDLRGARLVYRRTFAKYLDAVNFGGVNPTADPNEHLPDEVWLISQKASESPEIVTFNLASPLQFDDQKLPSRQVIAGTCGWATKAGPDGGYRGAWCGYTGTNYFDKSGNPVADPAADECGYRVSDCKKRHGEWEPLPYGGFPSADRIR